ncbi:hypothetical protein RUND412_007283 [Rhizina undulata]
MTQADFLRRVLDIEIVAEKNERRLTALSMPAWKGTLPAMYLFKACDSGSPPVLGAFLAQSETKRDSLTADGRAWEATLFILASSNSLRLPRWLVRQPKWNGLEVGAADFGRYYSRAFIQQQLVETARLEDKELLVRQDADRKLSQKVLDPGSFGAGPGVA